MHICDEDVFIENPYIEKIIFPEKFAVNCKSLELIIIDDNCKIEMPIKRMNFEDYIFTTTPRTHVTLVM